MTAALRRALRTKISISRSAVLAGAVAPDIPLYAMSLGAWIYFHLMHGWTEQATFAHMYDDLYFHDYGWMTAHNLLHAPVVELLALGLLWGNRLEAAGKRWWAFWFFASCAFHTAVDLATHYDDGPLSHFPFDWHTRIHSPVSYWDPAHHGNQFRIFELGLNVVLIVYLVAGWRRDLRSRREVYSAFTPRCSSKSRR